MLRPLALAALLLPLAAQAQHAGHDMTAAPAADAGPATELILGRIDVRTSATGAAAREIETGMLALHSFWYEEARDHFQAAQRIDAGAALALWGEAATHDHPLWSQHDSTAARSVFARVDSLRAAGALHADARETAFLDALGGLVRAGGSLSDRRDRYAEAMQRLAAHDPTDDEAAVVAALAAMSQDAFDYDVPARVVPVAAALEEVAARNPQHPGAQHYLIHVYDSAAFAPLGLRAARVYAGLAPAASHALHMPSHIFRELGMWAAMEASNRDAWAASVAWQERTRRPVSARDYHALGWLHDALLAQGRFADARTVRDMAEADAALAVARGEDASDVRADASSFVSSYLSVADVAGLPPDAVPLPDTLDVSAVTPYALWDVATRAVYAGQDGLADRATAGLEAFAASPRGSRAADQIRPGLAAFDSWRMQRRGDVAGALARAREAVRMDSTAHPAAPPTSDAYVQLADLRLASGDAAGSLAMYRAMEAARPRRAATELGVARAAAATGDIDGARNAYTRLLAVWARADAGLPAAAEARAYLDAHPAR